MFFIFFAFFFVLESVWSVVCCDIVSLCVCMCCMGWLCIDIIGFDAVDAVLYVIRSSVVTAQVAAAIFIEIVAYATGQQGCLTLETIWDWCVPPRIWGFDMFFMDL